MSKVRSVCLVLLPGKNFMRNSVEIEFHSEGGDRIKKDSELFLVQSYLVDPLSHTEAAADDRLPYPTNRAGL